MGHAARVVNDRFRFEGWLPLDLRIEDNFAQSVAAYKQFDVLLVNAIFDGMNLVAKEAPLVNTCDGVLVLSENAGAHDELAALFGQGQRRRLTETLRRGGHQGDAAADAEVNQPVQVRLWSTALMASGPYALTTTMSSMRAPHWPST